MIDQKIMDITYIAQRIAIERGVDFDGYLQIEYRLRRQEYFKTIDPLMKAKSILLSKYTRSATLNALCSRIDTAVEKQARRFAVSGN